MDKRIFNKQIIIKNYSIENSITYDNDINKNFLYGKETKNFVKKITLNEKDKIIADIGSGTGYVFEILTKKYRKKEMNLFGIEPANGMLKIARKKIKDNRVKFVKGRFEKISLKNNSVDKIISTLALHWADSIDNGLKELKRIIKPNGSINILMIEKNDGKEFKKIIFKVMKKFLNHKQIFNAANLINRITKKELMFKFQKYFDLRNEYTLVIKNKRKKIYGTPEQHIKWWKARSFQMISEVKDKELFINTLKNELNKYKKKKGIVFDLSLLEINLLRK